MPLEAQGCRHRAVTAREVAVGPADAAHRPEPSLSDYIVNLSCRHQSAVPGCFLNELHAGGESELGVDVREVGLHGALGVVIAFVYFVLFRVAMGGV
jgi:hypothetical protein